MRFHLPNEGVEGLENFALIFSMHMDFCFYIYGSLQVESCNLWHCFDAVEIRYAQIMKIIYSPVHHHILWCLTDLEVS